jgi:hypothetical protein
MRRTAIALVTLLALAVHCAPVFAQDFTFGSRFRVRGVTTHLVPGDQGGSLSGALNLDAVGSLTSGTLTRTPGPTTVYTGGGVAVANHAVAGVLTTGTSGRDVIVTGHVLNPDVLVFNTTAAMPIATEAGPLVANAELGLAFAVRQTGTYGDDDLRSSTWRFKAMSTPVLPIVYSDEGGWAFGRITLSTNRRVTGGSVTGPDGGTEVIYSGGTFTVDAMGTVTGSFAAGTVSSSDTVFVNGIMSPDKTMIVAAFRLRDDSYPSLANGLVILEREPAVTFATADLAGRWDLVGLEQESEPNGNVGRWVMGHVTLTGSGSISGGTLSSAGFEGVLSGSLSLSNGGFICSGGPVCDDFISISGADSSILGVRAIMSADKATIFGVYNRFTEREDEMRGLFTLVRRAAAPPSTVQFGAATYSRAESAGATSVTVIRTGSLATSATVRYMITGGSATRGTDYTAPISRVLTFDPGVRSVPLPVSIMQDTIEEASETIRFALRDPTGGMVLGARPSTVLTITDDDPAGALAFASAVYTAAEGGPAAVITVTRTGGTASGVTVQYATTNGTAIAGADYVNRAGTLTFAAGQTSRTFTVPILDDSLGEPVETVHLTLGSPGGGGFLGTRRTAVLRIVDNEPTISFTGRWIGNGLEVERTGPAQVTSRVDYAAIDDTAIAGVDYVALSGTLTFGPGVTRRVIPIVVLRDVTAEGSETFTVQLSRPVNARLGQAERQVVITDNDFGGTVQFESANYSVTEGGNRTITLTRTGGAGTELTVRYFTSNGTGIAGEHYVGTAGNLFFAVGQTRKTFTVRSLTDDSSADHTVRLHLTVPPGAATVGPRANAVLTILNDPGTL